MDTTKSKIDVTNKVPTGASTIDESLEQEYTDTKRIIISLVQNYSNYRKANMKVLGQRKETIGSSITSCQILSSNADEINAYFPPIVGLSPNHPDFTSRVKNWLSNIQYTISDTDATIDASFIYKRKADYLMIKKEEDAINEAFAKIDRTNLSAIKAAVKDYVTKLNTLESRKHKYGRPVNVQEYLLYRHCILYRDVAKDPALINSDASLRFYIKDVDKENERIKRNTEERKKALQAFLELGASEIKYNAIYTLVASAKGENIAEALEKSRTQRDSVLMEYATNYPDKFNKLVTDKNATTKATIESLIARGELKRSDYNQQIISANGDFIGSNMNEAVAYFNDPSNKDIVTVFENKLKQF